MNTDNLKKNRKYAPFDYVQKLYLQVNMDSHMLYIEVHDMSHLRT